MEFGPKSSRPHIHVLFFNIDRSDYVCYFGNTWRNDFGFTKTKYFSADPSGLFSQGGKKKDIKDLECISRYLSKYVSKGVFESPFVKDGLLPKPWRAISNGIGVAYLDRPVFDYFRKPVLSVYRDDCTIDASVMPGMGPERDCHVRALIRDGFLDEFPKPGERVLDALSTYVDRSGFFHPLPRYYKHKLLRSHVPNLCHYALQNALLARTKLFFNQNIQKLALSLGKVKSIRLELASCSDAGLGHRLYYLLCHEFVYRERLQACLEERRRFIKLRNHYGRSFNITDVLAC